LGSRFKWNRRAKGQWKIRHQRGNADQQQQITAIARLVGCAPAINVSAAEAGADMPTSFSIEIVVVVGRAGCNSGRHGPNFPDDASPTMR
jgi:hypothetical protein